MRRMGYIGMGLALALVSTSTLAFQEQGGAPAPAPEQAAPAAPPTGEQKNLDFSAPKAEGSDNTGTEVRIPGLGKLGVLPKMDFGLELLYGANESKSPEPAEQPAEEDLTIRGSIKHNF